MSLPESLQLAQFTTMYRNLSAGVTGAVVKAAPGHLHNMVVSNVGAVAVYVKLYDLAAAPTAANTPIYTVGIPAGWVQPLQVENEPIVFLNGISLRATTGVADADVAAPAASTCIINMGYK